MAAFLLLAPVRWEDRLPLTAEAPIVLEIPAAEVRLSRQEGLALLGPGVPSQAEVPAASFPLEQLLTVLWLSGAALRLLYHLAGTWRFLRRACRWSRPAGEEPTLL